MSPARRRNNLQMFGRSLERLRLWIPAGIDYGEVWAGEGGPVYTY